MSYPLDASKRQALRDQMLREGRRKGEDDAQRMFRSPTCHARWYANGDQHQPCRNDGSGCLCGCHEQDEAAGA
jgi:hypothetical protein